MTDTLKRNRRPTHPGVLLNKLYLEPRGILHREFAADIEISTKHLSQIINGHKRVTPLIAGRIAMALQTTSRLWLNGQAAVDEWDARQNLKDWKPAIIYPANGMEPA